MSQDWLPVAQHAVRQHGAMQKPAELANLLALLDGREINHVLEVGGMFGGTVWAWQHIQLASGRLVCVDNHTLEGRLENAPEQHIAVIGDSRDSETRKRVQELCPEPFDFVFIDASHEYADVWLDAINWKPLLAVGGVMAFHDICHRRMLRHDMWRFWQEVRQGWHSLEIYDSEQEARWGGIGVISAKSLSHASAICQPGGWLQAPEQCQPLLCERCHCELNLEEEGLCRDCAKS